MDFTDNSKLLICFSISFCSYLILWNVFNSRRTLNRMCLHCVFVVYKTYVSFLGPIVCVPRALVVGSSGWVALLAQSIMTTGCRNKIRRQNITVSAWITCTMFETNCSGGKMLFQEKKKNKTCQMMKTGAAIFGECNMNAQHSQTKRRHIWKNNNKYMIYFLLILRLFWSLNNFDKYN